MTLYCAGRLGGCPFAIITDPETGEEIKYVCLDCDMESAPDADSFLDARSTLCKGREPAPRPTPPPPPELQLPEGYKAEKQPGGYYFLTDPKGENIPGPSNGKYQGLDAAVLAARDHHSDNEE